MAEVRVTLQPDFEFGYDELREQRFIQLRTAVHRVAKAVETFYNKPGHYGFEVVFNSEKPGEAQGVFFVQAAEEDAEDEVEFNESDVFAQLHITEDDIDELIEQAGAEDVGEALDAEEAEEAND